MGMNDKVKLDNSNGQLGEDYSNIENEVSNQNQLNQEVYEEMKNQSINRDQLINLLKMESPFFERENITQSPNTLKKQMEDVRSQYTLSTIEACNNIKFIFLLLRNYTSGSPNTEIIGSLI